VTPRQQKVLEFVQAYITVKGYAPSYNNIAQGLGLKSRSNIHRIVHDLRIAGFLKIDPHKFRSLKVVDKSVKRMMAL